MDMEELFPSASKEEILDRKIEVVSILLDRFQEQLESTNTPVLREWSLHRIRYIKKDFEEITKRIRDLKKIYSKKIE